MQEVLDQAKKYADAASAGTGDCDAIRATNAVALAAINYVWGQRGFPYLWGGNGPQDGGFDCSGLTVAAYGAAGVALPRTADARCRAGPRVPDGQPLLSGGLVFYGTAAYIHHVGLYIGGGLMIEAPDVGQPVKVEPFRYHVSTAMTESRCSRRFVQGRTGECRRRPRFVTETHWLAGFAEVPMALDAPGCAAAPTASEGRGLGQVHLDDHGRHRDTFVRREGLGDGRANSSSVRTTYLGGVIQIRGNDRRSQRQTSVLRRRRGGAAYRSNMLLRGR